MTHWLHCYGFYISYCVAFTVYSFFTRDQFSVTPSHLLCIFIHFFLMVHVTHVTIVWFLPKCGQKDICKLIHMPLFLIYLCTHMNSYLSISRFFYFILFKSSRIYCVFSLYELLCTRYLFIYICISAFWSLCYLSRRGNKMLVLQIVMPTQPFCI